MTDDSWRKSSHSGSQANCVEIRTAAGAVMVRDTKDHQGQSIIVSPGDWRRFAMNIKERLHS
jgi:Domain of unknown function (DUF397)